MPEIDPNELSRDEFEELHERLATLTDRVASLERDRETLLAAVEEQADALERAESRLADCWPALVDEPNARVGFRTLSTIESGPHLIEAQPMFHMLAVRRTDAIYS